MLKLDSSKARVAKLFIAFLFAVFGIFGLITLISSNADAQSTSSAEFNWNYMHLRPANLDLHITCPASMQAFTGYIVLDKTKAFLQGKQELIHNEPLEFGLNESISTFCFQKESDQYSWHTSSGDLVLYSGILNDSDDSRWYVLEWYKAAR